MKCPKCGLEIDNNVLVCPNCKKVLKLVCPVCKTINEKNTCKKCGYVILTKCNKCGKIALTQTGNCKKCGTSLDKSVILNEANTDDFAFLTINFPNISSLRDSFDTLKQYNRFKINLDKIISHFATSLKLRRQVFDNTYVIRFYNDYSFKSSSNTAVNASIELLNKIATLNWKLKKRRKTPIKCKMFLTKKSVNDDPLSYKSEFNVNLIHSDKDKSDESKIYSTFQIITDNAIQEVLAGNYKLDSLSPIEVDGKMRMFYELDLKDYIKIDTTSIKDDDEDTNDAEIPNFVQNMLQEQEQADYMPINNPNKDSDKIYDIKSIDFEEINCDFVRCESADIFLNLVNKLQTVQKGIIAIKADKLHIPYSLKLVNTVEELKIFENIITITCYDEMKYTPYAFFRDLVSAIFDYSTSQKLFFQNDFSVFNNIDPKHLVEDLIALSQKNEFPDIISARNEYFKIFLTMLEAVPNTLIFIEDFDKIDTSSYEVLKLIFNVVDKLQISWLLTYGKDFSLHKDFHELLSKPYYTEIALKSSRFEKIIVDNKKFYKNVMNDFYFQRIAKYACGSVLFLDIAVQYLVECGVYEFKKDTLIVANPKTIIIPSNIDKLFRRRLNLLKDDSKTMRFLAMMLLLGTRIDMATIESLGYEDTPKIIDKLVDMGYIYFYNDYMYFPNYNLVRDNLLEVMNKIDLQKIANELFAKVFLENMPSPVKSYLYTLISDESNAFLEWDKLAKVNLSLGDFNSFLNCANEIIKILETKKIQDADEYKLGLYRDIANNLYEYIPEKTQGIAELALKNLEKTTEKDKIIELCNRMITGALSTSNYSHALALTHKILSIIPNASVNPNDENFNVYFFLMSLVHIEILFNIGALEDCIEIGRRVLNVIDMSNIDKCRPEYMDDATFKNLLNDCTAYVAISSVLQLKNNVQEFLAQITGSLDFIPKSFSIFVKLQNLIAGDYVDLDEFELDDNKFSNSLYHIINAFLKYKDKKEEFAKEIYQAKLCANKSHLPSIEIFCDLLIAYSYMNIESYEKSTSILYKIIKSIKEKGFILLEVLAWYILSEKNIRLKNYDLAYGILNNTIIRIQKENKTNDYLMMLLKYNMYKVLNALGKEDKSNICLNQAEHISNKYDLGFAFNRELSVDNDDNEKKIEHNEISEEHIDNFDNEEIEYVELPDNEEKTDDMQEREGQ